MCVVCFIDVKSLFFSLLWRGRSEEHSSKSAGVKKSVISTFNTVKDSFLCLVFYDLFPIDPEKMF